LGRPESGWPRIEINAGSLFLVKESWRPFSSRAVGKRKLSDCRLAACLLIYPSDGLDTAAGGHRDCQQRQPMTSPSWAALEQAGR